MNKQEIPNVAVTLMSEITRALNDGELSKDEVFSIVTVILIGVMRLFKESRDDIEDV